MNPAGKTCQVERLIDSLVAAAGDHYVLIFEESRVTGGAVRNAFSEQFLFTLDTRTASQ